MKKKLLVGSLTVLSALTLSGCDNDETNNNYTGPEYGDTFKDPSEITATISFWHTMGAANQLLLDGMITEFNKTYPNITIEHSAQGGYDDLKDKVSTAIIGGNQPNLAFCYPDHVASYLSQQVVVDLGQYIYSATEDYAISEEDQEDFVEAYWDEGTVYNSLGTMFSFPYAKSTEVMFYNKTLFNENNWDVPETWDDVWELSAEIKTTYPDKMPFSYDSESNMVITLLEQNKLPYTSSDPSNRYTFNTTEAVDLFTDIQEYYNKGYFYTSALNNDNYGSTDFTAGNLLMTVGSSGGASYNEPPKDGNGEYMFEYGVTTVPQVDVNNRKVIQQGPSLVILEGTEDQQLASWLFIKHLTNTQNSAIYAASTGYSPVRNSSTQTDIFKNALSQGTIQANVLQVAVNQNDAYFTSAAFNGSSDARAQMGFIMEKICISQTDVATAFKSAYDELTK